MSKVRNLAEAGIKKSLKKFKKKMIQACRKEGATSSVSNIEDYVDYLTQTATNGNASQITSGTARFCIVRGYSVDEYQSIINGWHAFITDGTEEIFERPVLNKEFINNTLESLKAVPQEQAEVNAEAA